MMLWTTALTAALGGAASLAALHWLRRRGIDPGLALTLLRQSLRRATVPASGAHILLCVADHFEPLHGEGTSLTAVVGSELLRSVTTASVGKPFPTTRPSWHRHAPLMAMMRHCRGSGRPDGRTPPASRTGHGS